MQIQFSVSDKETIIPEFKILINNDHTHFAFGIKIFEIKEREELNQSICKSSTKIDFFRTRY